MSIAVSADSSFSFVTDFGNYRLRKITIASGLVETVAGCGRQEILDGTGENACFTEPRSVTIANDNSFALIADMHTIRKFVIATQAVTTLAGDVSSAGEVNGYGPSARFSHAKVVALAPDQSTVFVLDSYSIRKIRMDTHMVTTLVAGPSGVLSPYPPKGVCIGGE
jgi:DNA-binding beta-propeller fold protein YncE